MYQMVSYIIRLVSIPTAQQSSEGVVITVAIDALFERWHSTRFRMDLYCGLRRPFHICCSIFQQCFVSLD